MDMTKITTAILLSLLIVGCDNDDDVSIVQDEPFTLSGAVIDGYISNALVWIDMNRNGVLDGDDPQAYSSFDGTYTLELSESQANSIIGLPIFAKLTNESVDVGTSPLSSSEELESLLSDGTLTTIFSADKPNHSITLSMPPLNQNSLSSLMDGSIDQQVISPFTTKVYQDIEETLSRLMEVEFSEDEQEQLILLISQMVDDSVTGQIDQLRTDLDCASTCTDEELANLIQGDFLASGFQSEEMGEIAQSLVEEMKQNEDKAQELSEKWGEDAVASYQTFSGTDFYTPYNTTSPITVNYSGHSQSVTVGTQISSETYNEEHRVTGPDTTVLYSQSLARGVEDTETGDFYTMGEYQSDLNRTGDEDLNFTSFSYDVGVHRTEGDAQDVTYISEITRYIDEADPWEAAGVYTSWGEPSGRQVTYETVDNFVDAVQSGDLSGVDALQKVQDKSKLSLDHDFYSTEFTEYDVTRSSPFDYPTYRQVNSYWDYFDGSTTEIIAKDWNADGTFNNIETNEFFADTNLSQSSMHEIVWQDDYEGTLINYWQQAVFSSYVDSNDNYVSKSVGEKYILDDVNNTKLLDSSGEGLMFNSWGYTSTKYSDSDIREFVKWKHYQVEGYDFTEDKAGQKYSTTIDGTYTAYIEAWGPFIEDLPTFVDTLIEEGASEQAIWLRVVSESLISARSLQAFEDCSIDVTGNDASRETFVDHLVACGGTEPLRREDISGRSVARLKNGGSELRIWDLYEDGTAGRRTWKENEEQYKDGYTWFINTSGHLVLERGDDIREMAAYHKFNGDNEVYGAAMIVFNESPDEQAVWNTFFIDITDVWIPYDVTWID